MVEESDSAEEGASGEENEEDREMGVEEEEETDEWDERWIFDDEEENRYEGEMVADDKGPPVSSCGCGGMEATAAMVSLCDEAQVEGEQGKDALQCD